MTATTTLVGERWIVLGGEFRPSRETCEVSSPYDRLPVAVVHQAAPEKIGSRPRSGVRDFIMRSRR
jgi:hypothetical protein